MNDICCVLSLPPRCAGERYVSCTLTQRLCGSAWTKIDTDTDTDTDIDTVTNMDTHTDANTDTDTDTDADADADMDT